MRAGEVATELARDAEGVCEHLLPQGKRQGREWLAGSVGGESGQSLRVALTGNRAGLWVDHAEAGSGGDLLDLWAACRSLSVAEALREAKEYLGIREPQFHPAPELKPAKLKAPQGARKAGDDEAVMRWLTETRKLSPESVKAYRVAAHKGAVTLPAFAPDGHIQYLKYRSIAEKQFWSEKGGVPCLFGWQAVGNERVAVLCEGECFPGDAEVMTPHGWVRLDTYEAGMVAQWSPDGSISWVHPLARIKKPFSGNLIRYENRGYTSVTTPGHNLVSLDKHGRPYKHTAEQGPTSGAHTVPRCGVMDGEGLALTDAELRLAIAVSADATIDERLGSYAGGEPRNAPRERRYARLGLLKQRKVERLRRVLSEVGIVASDAEVGGGYQSICFPLPDWVPGRFLPWDWVAKASARQREIMLEELVEWDGNRVAGRNQHEYNSKYQHNAEWVQALAHLSGRCSTVMRRSNRYGQWMKVSILHGKQTNSWQSMRGCGQAEAYSGNVYCLQVPSGALIVRQSGAVTVSGNCDAIAWHSYGFPALSPTNGAKNLGWIDTEFDRLAQFDQIYISMDMDEAGQAVLDEMTERLGRDRCYIVSLPRKDANECLMAGVSMEAMSEAIAGARSLDPDELVSASRYADAVVSLFWPSDEVEPGVRLPWKKAGNRVVFRPGEVSLIGGVNGHGKSEMAGLILLEAMSQGVRCCVASMEFKPEKWLKRLDRQAAAVNRPSEQYIREIHNWFTGRLWAFNAVGNAKADRILEVFRYAVRRYGIRWFVVDNLAKCGFDEDDYNAQKKFVDRLTDFARDHDAHVQLCVHMRKGHDEDKPAGKMDVKGTGAITDMVDTVMVLWRNKKKEEERRIAEQAQEAFNETEKPDAVFQCVKQRNGDEEPKLLLWFCRESHQYIAGAHTKPFRYVPFSMRDYEAVA